MRALLAVLFLAIGGFSYAAYSADDVSSLRGHTVYEKYCSKCHGKEADGRGKDAYKYKPAPTDFHSAGAARAYMEEITKKGGKGVGRSDNMPDWGDDLSTQQIQDVVNYIMSVRRKPS